MRKIVKALILIVIVLVVIVEGLALINISGITGYRVSFEKGDDFRVIVNVKKLD